MFSPDALATHRHCRAPSAIGSGRTLAAALLLSLAATAVNAAELPTLVHGSPNLEALTEFDRGQLIGGVKHALVEALGERLDTRVHHLRCPLQRCLRGLHTGDINLMVLVTINAARRQHMHFLEIWPSPAGISFFMRPGESQRLQSYDDLLSLRIGVVDGYSQFEPFASDPRLHKVSVPREEQLSKMLLGNRLDTYLGYKSQPQLVEAPFKPPPREVALLAVSKASELAEHLPALQRALDSLRLDGSLDRIWEAHFKDSPRPYRPALTSPERRRGPP